MQMVKGSSPFGRIRPNYLGNPLTDKSYPLLLIRLREVEDDGRYDSIWNETEATKL